MNKDCENVKQAKESFNRILDNKKYAGIIRDDKHLAILIDLLIDGNYHEILDIGTGTGYLAFPLAQRFPTARVYGIDIAESIIAQNNEMVKEKGISNLTFHSFDGLTYPFAAESFDLIVTCYAFHHFPNVTDVIKQIHKLLVKDGKVLISDSMRNAKDERRIIDDFMCVKKDGHIQFYSADELTELFLNNGFVLEKQVITDMRFPFASKEEYTEVYNKTSEEDRQLYNITNENDTVWVKHIDVWNIVFVKK